MWEVENLSVCNTISEAFGEDSLGWVTKWQRNRREITPAQKRLRTDGPHHNKSALRTVNLLQESGSNSVSE